MNEMKVTWAWAICNAKNQTVFSLAPLALIFVRSGQWSPWCKLPVPTKTNLKTHCLATVPWPCYCQLNAICWLKISASKLFWSTKSCPFLFCKASTGHRLFLAGGDHRLLYVGDSAVLYFKYFIPCCQCQHLSLKF